MAHARVLSREHYFIVFVHKFHVVYAGESGVPISLSLSVRDTLNTRNKIYIIYIKCLISTGRFLKVYTALPPYIKYANYCEKYNTEHAANRTDRFKSKKKNPFLQ